MGGDVIDNGMADGGHGVTAAVVGGCGIPECEQQIVQQQTVMQTQMIPYFLWSREEQRAWRQSHPVPETPDY